MTSRVAESFWKQYLRLPSEVQELTHKNYRIWRLNPHHPSLRFKPLKRGHWSVRVGAHYRAIGFFLDRETFIWTWIGTHEDYNKLP